MRFQFFSRIAGAALLTFAFAFIAVAQTTTGSGTVKLRQADGTEVPVQGATVVFYRTDIRGEYRIRTDRNGRYVHVGLPVVGTYTIVVSAPNARPSFMANVRVINQPENNFVLEPGDGSTLTLEQVRAAAAAGGTAATASGPSAADNAEARRAAAEAERRRAEFEEERRRAEATNVRLNDVLRAGNDAFNAAVTAARAGRGEEAINQFTQAITHFDQGVQADPAQGVFHLNRSVALRSRGVERYNAAARARNNEGTAAARSDFTASIESAERAVAAYRALASSGATQGAAAGAAAMPAPAAGQANPQMLSALEARAESYRLAMQTNTPNVDADAAVKAIEEYVAAETDATKKARAQASLGDALFQSGRVEEAIASHRRTLQNNPNNVDAIYGLGLALASDPSGANSSEARTMLQQFLSKAPPTDSRREMATQIIAGLDEAVRNQRQPQQQQRPARRGRP